jgi:hypothetical protein
VQSSQPGVERILQRQHQIGKRPVQVVGQSVTQIIHHRAEPQQAIIGCIADMTGG